MVFPVLYSFRRCPYAMRARLAIAASGIRCELREVVLKSKPAEILAASPKGTVPVLVLPEGQVLEQSLDIMRWALQQNDPQQWLPGEAAQADTAALIAACDGPFKQQLDRYKYPNRHGLADGATARSLAADFLHRLEQQLAARGFLNGMHFGLADAAIVPFVRQFAHTDPAWFASQPWPQLQQWLAAFETSVRFLQIMDKVPPWVAGQAPVAFPSTLAG